MLGRLRSRAAMPAVRAATRVACPLPVASAMSTFTVIPVKSDGNCQYRALAVGLCDGDEKRHPFVRRGSAEWLATRPDLEPFLVTAEFSSWQEFVNHVEREGTWGDHITLFGAASKFDVDVAVHLADDSKPVQVVSPDDDKNAKRRVVRVMYYPERKHYDAVSEAK